MIQTSNFGEAVYPFLSSPDTHFKTEGEYHVKLKVKKSDAQEDIKKRKNKLLRNPIRGNESYELKRNKQFPLKNYFELKE